MHHTNTFFYVWHVVLLLSRQADLKAPIAPLIHFGPFELFPRQEKFCLPGHVVVRYLPNWTPPVRTGPPPLPPLLPRSPPPGPFLPVFGLVGCACPFHALILPRVQLGQNHI